MTSLLAAVVLACPPVVPSVLDVFPADGTTGLPANVAIAFETNIRDGSLATMVTVTSAMGGFSGAASIGDGDVWVFDPGSDLAAGTWLATIVVDDGASDPVSRSFDFTVGGAADTEPPDGTSFAPVLDIGEYVDAPPIDDCPDPPGVWAVSAEWDDVTDASPVIYAVRGLLRTESDATIAGPPDSTFSLEVFVLDAAGNASAFPAAMMELPSPPVEGDPGSGCGCTLAGTRARVPPFAAIALALAALVSARGRAARGS